MNFLIEAKIPPQPAFASLVHAFVQDAAWRAELQSARRQAIARCSAAAFEQIVRDAMADDAEPIRVVATCTPEHLRISLFERGMPIDETLAQRNGRWGRITAEVDEAHWRLHGKHGTELELCVERPASISGNGGAPIAHENIPPAPPQSYTVRRFRPEDAAGVARAFYMTYGYDYTLSAVYVPERLTALNASNDYISMVAVAEDGEIAGHYALHRDPGTPIADGCGALVVPVHRGRDLLKQMRYAVEREAQALGLAAYYTEPVTSHPRTQRESFEVGARACALTLGGSPPSFLARHMDVTTKGQRQSFMLYFKALQPRGMRTIYPPVHHRPMIEKIYANLDLPVDVRNGKPAAAGKGELRTKIERGDGIATIAVKSIGSETPDLAAQTVIDLRSLSHLGALYALVPLEDPAAPQLSDALERLGFFFSGVGPWMIDGTDALRLQMPLTPIDMSLLTIDGEFGNELFDYVRTFVS
jgi:hypothetical protein